MTKVGLYNNYGILILSSEAFLETKRKNLRNKVNMQELVTQIHFFLYIPFVLFSHQSSSFVSHNLFSFHLIFFHFCSKNDLSPRSKNEYIHRVNEKPKIDNMHRTLKVDEKIGLSF